MSAMTITLNGEPRQARPGSTVAELLAGMEVAAKHVAVEVNLQIVPRSRHAEHRLADGDRVEVVTLVGGG
jgi:sulfur carrier protein